MTRIDKTLFPLPGVRPAATPGTQGPRPTPDGQKASADFGQVFERELAEQKPVSFSTHAQSRLISRHIQLSEQQMSRLSSGVDQAAQKGAKDSLVMLDNLAFIVNIGHRKVITALDGAQQTGNVFTQIDSAVIV